MDDFICCLKFIDGKFHRINLSTDELDELNRVDSPNKWRTKYTCQLPGGNASKATVLIWESVNVTRQFVYNRRYLNFTRAIHRYAIKYARTTQSMIIFEKNAADEYVSVTNDEYIIHALSRLHSRDLREWVEADDFDEFD